MTIILGLLIWNCLVFLIYRRDKSRAKQGRSRVRERTLLLLALFFGASGALAAMILGRHKTKKPVFLIGVPLALVINALSYAVLWQWMGAAG